MTRGQRTIVALLAAVAVLLGLNLLSDRPEVKAQVETGEHFTGACCLPNGACVTGWTAGECASVSGTWNGAGSLCNQPGSLCLPAPTVVSMTVDKDSQTTGSVQFRVFRGFDNGDVDMTWIEYQSGIPGSGVQCNELNRCGPVQVIPPPCPADVNDDLAVNVLDLIDVLLAFGSTCPTGKG